MGYEDHAPEQAIVEYFVIRPAATTAAAASGVASFDGHEVPVAAAGSGEAVENGFCVEGGTVDQETARVRFLQRFPDGSRTVSIYLTALPLCMLGPARTDMRVGSRKLTCACGLRNTFIYISTIHSMYLHVSMGCTNNSTCVCSNRRVY